MISVAIGGLSYENRECASFHAGRFKRRQEGYSFLVPVAIKLSLGEYDIACVPELKAELSRADGTHTATVDLGTVTYIDSACLGVMASTADRLEESGGSLRFVNVSPGIRKLLEICGVGHYIAG
jgi:anti-anti-sigma factor